MTQPDSRESGSCPHRLVLRGEPVDYAALVRDESETTVLWTAHVRGRKITPFVGSARALTAAEARDVARGLTALADHPTLENPDA